MTRIVLALLGVTLVSGAAVSPAAAAAQDPRDAQAVLYFQAGKLVEAAEIYAKLREESGNAKYSCNLGLCYAKMGYLDPAIETVRHCLDNATLSAGTRADYQDLLGKLQAQRQVPAAGATPPPVETPLQPMAAPAADPNAAAWPAAPVAPVAAAPAPEAYPAYPPPPPAYQPYQYPAYPPAPAPQPEVATAPDREESRGKKRIPFGSYVCGTAGLVSGALGVALILHTQAISQEIAGSTTADSDRQLLESDRSRAKKGATAAFIAGGVGLTAAVIWRIVAPSYSKPTLAGRALDVAVGPDGVGVSGRF